MTTPVTEAEALVSFIEVFNRGAQRAAVDVVEALAEKLGVRELDGVSIRAFYNSAATERTKQAIAEIADTDPALATVVRQQVDESASAVAQSVRLSQSAELSERSARPRAKHRC